MDEKKKKIIISAAVILAVITVIVFIASNIRVEKIEEGNPGSEIIPEEEISDKQLRETMINLYYIDENKEITSEYRKIDSKELLEEPYIQVLNMLIDGPKNDNLRTAIPIGTKVKKIEREGDCLKIDFSKEFIDNQTENVEEQGLVINQIVNTMTQFSEINSIKITVEGKSDVTFRDGNINFEQIFTVES